MIQKIISGVQNILNILLLDSKQNKKGNIKFHERQLRTNC